MITFHSDALNRTVQFDQVGSLNEEELRLFHEELTSVVKTLDDVIFSAKQKEKASGVPVSSDWVHRVTTKRRVALKFATEAYSQLHGGTTVQQRIEYDKIYRIKLREFLESEFEADELAEIDKELISESRKAYEAWIQKTNQRMWFVP